MKINAKTKKHPTPIAVDFDLPAGLDAKVKKFGADVVDAMAEDSIIINVQALVRRHIEKGVAPAEIQKAVAAWSPSVRTMIRQSAFEKASSSLDKLSPEERKQLLAKLNAIPANQPAAVAAAPAAKAA